IGAEGAVVVAGDDAGIDHGRDGGVVPVAGLHVGEAAVGGVVVVAGVVGEQTVEDGGHLGAGDVVLGLDASVGIALDIGVMVAQIQPVGRGFVGNIRQRGEDGTG